MKHAYLTINSANYIPRTTALMESIKAQDPGAHAHVVLSEGDAACALVKDVPGVRLWPASALGVEGLGQMSFYYDITEFNTALKPSAILALFEEGYDAVTYFDPDIEVFSSTKPLEELLSRYELLLTPHISSPAEEDGLFPSVQACIHAGQFNLGFISVRDTPQVRAFLNWWVRRLRESCLMEPNYWLFVDQFWASAGPSFVDETRVVRSEAWNMAYWNYGHRTLRRENGRFVTGDGPLFFFHYSGYDFSQPSRLSRFTERQAAVEPGSDLDALLSGYRARVARQAGLHPYGHIPYSHGAYADGTPVSAKARRRFLALSPSEREALGDPFACPDRLEEGRQG